MLNSEIRDFLKQQKYINSDIEKLEELEIDSHSGMYDFKYSIFQDFLKKIKEKNSDVNKSSKQINESSIQDIDSIQDVHSTQDVHSIQVNQSSELRNDKNMEILNSKLITIEHNSFVTQLFKNSIYLKILDIESIYMAFCIVVYDKFLIYDDSHKKNFMAKLKEYLGIEFDKYKQNYKSKVNKTAFMNNLLINKILNMDLFFKFLADYFNVNFICLDDTTKKATFFNKFVDTLYTVVIIQKDTDYFVEFNCDNTSLILGSELISKKLIEKPINPILLQKNLSELQKMATEKSIEIKKMGKQKLINKKKDELISELNKFL